MLKYKVKPFTETKLNDFPIREVYISPDLSYISGVTDYDFGVVNGEQVVIKSPYLIGDETNTINTLNVKRQGKVGVSIVLPVKKITKSLLFPLYTDEDGNNYIIAFNQKVTEGLEDFSGNVVLSSVTQNYVEYNGDISYFFNDGEKSGYLVNGKYYFAERTDEEIEINTFLYIEDGRLVVGENVYYADFDGYDKEIGDVKKPTLTLNKYEEPLEYSPDESNIIGKIDGNDVKLLPDSDNTIFIKDYTRDKWERVTKFAIVKMENPKLEVDDVLYGGYRHYVTYGGNDYYASEVYDDGEYKGYGVVINNIFYPVNTNYGNDELYERYHDLPMSDGLVYVIETGEYESINDSIVSFSEGGCFMFLIVKSEDTDITIGNHILAESNGSILINAAVQTDENDAKYIVFQNRRYDVKNHLCDYVEMSENKYELKYSNEDYSVATSTVNGELYNFTIRNKKATLDEEIYYRSNGSAPIIVKYGKHENAYNVVEQSGVTIGNKNYPVIANTNDPNAESILTIVVNEMMSFDLLVNDVDGASTLICYPYINDDEVSEVEINSMQREISSIIVENKGSFTFKVRKDTFGDKIHTPENGLMESMTSDRPYTMSNKYDLLNNIKIFRINNYLSFDFPLCNKLSTNIRKEDIIKTEFVDYIKNKSLNNITDMEKDIYYPVWMDTDKYGKPTYNSIKQIVFNFHFRTRNLSNWKIIEDDREFSTDITPNTEMCNWFITDHVYYKNCFLGQEFGKYLHNSSDLLGFVGFTDEEINLQSSKLAKSFLRLSFYSTNNPQTQVLLATSTVFFNENIPYKKQKDLKRNSDLAYIDINMLTRAFNEAEPTPDSNVVCPYNSGFDRFVNSSEYQITSNTTSVLSEVIGDDFFNDALRLSSRIVIDDKYNTDTSSEGFYLYLFKEYAKKMREATIYLRIDFNHAGIGKSIPFTIPRSIGSDGDETPLYLHNGVDVEILKKGFEMKDIYKQLYIPIKIIYDDKNNRYVYYLPESLRENKTLDVDNDIMVFNLFEIKFANESIVTIETEEKNEGNQ